MKPSAVLLSLLVLETSYLAEQQQPPQKGTIEGIVVRIGTGEPIAGARVVASRALSGQLVPGISQAPFSNLPPGATVATAASSIGPLPGNLSVTTDAQGRFSLKDLDAGSFRLTIAANGYARQEYGQRFFGAQSTLIEVGAGQTLKDLTIRLTPAGYVNGRITDDTGKPAVAAQVQLIRASYNVNGQKTFQSAGSTRTNDRGEYRLFWVTPGRYYLYATTPRGPTSISELTNAPDIPNSVQESYATTFYPGAMDIKDAALVEVQPNVEVSAIDFSVPRQRLFRIRGRVIDSRTGQRPAAATITLGSRSLTGGGFTSSSAQSYNAADGGFELRDVPAGSYVVGAQIQEGTQGAQPPIFTPGMPSRPVGSVPVTVSGSDVDGILVTIFAGTSLPGRLSVEGQELAAITGLDRIRVQLTSPTVILSPSSLPTPQSQPVNPDGTFREDSTFPGEYRVSVVGLPPGFNVKEVRFDQTDALNKPLQFTGSVSGPIEVLLSPKAAQIEGTVSNEKQEVLPGVQAVLIPDQHRDRIDLYKTVVTDQKGHFTIRGVPPGEYRIFAWEAIEQYSYFDPEVVQRFESRGKPVRVLESDTVTTEVRIIPADSQ